MVGTVIDRVQVRALLFQERFQLIVNLLQPSLVASASRDGRLVRDHHGQNSRAIQASDCVANAWDEFELIRREQPVYFDIERPVSVEKYRRTRF